MDARLKNDSIERRLEKTRGSAALRKMKIENKKGPSMLRISSNTKRKEKRVKAVPQRGTEMWNESLIRKEGPSHWGPTLNIF